MSSAVWRTKRKMSHSDAPGTGTGDAEPDPQEPAGWRLYPAGLRNRPPSVPDLARSEAERGGPYDGVSAPTLRAWLAYWKGVQDGSVCRNDVDAGIDEGHEVSRLTAELETRTHAP